MNFFQAIESGLRKYVDFSGRAARSEFWYFTLFVVVVGWVAAILDLVAFPALTGSPLNAAFNLAMLLPSVAISARRLHDIDRTGWWFLILFTVVGSILLLVWWCTKGTSGDNQYGPDPLASASNPGRA